MVSTVAILAQGTSLALASQQAFWLLSSPMMNVNQWQKMQL